MRTSKISKYSACIILAANSLSASAQNAIDASKYAQSNPLATARSVGFGGALGSVGGDMGSLSVNPAGLGVYRSSEFIFTPGLRFSGTNSSYNSTEMNDNGTRFGLNSLGFVYTSAVNDKDYDRADWKAISFGLGLNRSAEYSRNYNYGGKNYTSSASQYFEGDAFKYPNSTTADPGTPAYLGYQSYLLSNLYTTYVPYNRGIQQLKTVNEKGGATDLNLSLGGNYQDKLMLGATLGFNFLNHKVNSTMSEETFTMNEVDSFDHFNYTENFKTIGTGVNLKLGAIYKFNDNFRAGLAIHTPTAYGLTETSDNNINVSSLKYGNNTVSTSPNEYNYNFYTPFKAVVSATAILGKLGFISADYEFVGYSGMRYKLDDLNYQNTLNSLIQNLYQSNSNVRVGAEIRLDDFRLRAGYGYYGSPFKNKLYQGDRQDISFGMGYRFGNTFVDLAVINSSYKTYEQPYVLDGALGYVQPNMASINNSLTSGLLTIGWKF